VYDDGFWDDRWYLQDYSGSEDWSIVGVDALERRAGAATPDRFERNDTFAAATDFGTLGYQYRTEDNLSIHGCNNHDYYKVTAAYAGTLRVDVDFLNSEGNLALCLYDSSFTLVASSDGAGDNEVVFCSMGAWQTYYIEVLGVGGAVNPNYSLAAYAINCQRPF
jgi:hypothetical protein